MWARPGVSHHWLTLGAAHAGHPLLWVVAVIARRWVTHHGLTVVAAHAGHTLLRVVPVAAGRRIAGHRLALRAAHPRHAVLRIVTVAARVAHCRRAPRCLHRRTAAGHAHHRPALRHAHHRAALWRAHHRLALGHLHHRLVRVAVLGLRRGRQGAEAAEQRAGDRDSKGGLLHVRVSSVLRNGRRRAWPPVPSVVVPADGNRPTRRALAARWQHLGWRAGFLRCRAPAWRRRPRRSQRGTARQATSMRREGYGHRRSASSRPRSR